MKAAFADVAHGASSAPAWVDLRGDWSTLCARDARGTVACAFLDEDFSCVHAPCTGREPKHFRARPYRVPQIATTAIAVAPTFLLREDGSVSAFRLELDREAVLEDVPWFHGALTIDAASGELFPVSGIAVSDNIQSATTTCARMPANEIRCSMPTSSFRPPKQLTLRMASSAISIGWQFACAITATAARAVMCWGANNKGQLGDGTRRSSDAAVLVRGLGDVIQIDATASSACALRADGRVACWGRGWDGDTHDTPQWVPGLTNIAEIAVGLDYLCARLRSGAITCLGKNDHQQLGSNEATEGLGHSTIDGLDAVVHVVALQDTTCALRSNHSIVCWGRFMAPETITLPTSGQL